jgi:uncharacterized protein CbrC (UPF0167 family)
MIVKVTEDRTGPLSVFHVVKEVIACDNCCCTEDQVIESFHSYAEADAYCNALIADGKAADDYTTACGEEKP